MNNKKDKVKFLQNLHAGKAVLRDILPVRFMTFFKTDGVITDERGEVFNEDEINSSYSMSLNNTWVEI